MFRKLNRWLGFPQRVFVTTEFSYDHLINLFNGKRPCFASVARFTTKNESFMEFFPYDLDSKGTWKLPYKEALKLQRFHVRKDIPYLVIGSGGKGFHVYFLFEEELVTQEVYNKIYSIQYCMKKNLDLRTTDVPLFGRKEQLIRIPTTKYVSIKKKKQKKVIIKNDNYCRYIPPEDLIQGLPHIENLVKSPGTIPTLPKKRPTLDEIIDLLPNYKYKEKSDSFIDMDLSQGGTLTPSLKAVGLPCLQTIARRKNPPHADRIELVAWLKLQGYRDMAIINFIKEMHALGAWTNFDSVDSTNNIISIYPRLPACSYLREKYYKKCENCPLRRYAHESLH